MSSLSHLDPSFTQLDQNDSLPIDPALFQLEEVVNDVRRGKVKLEDQAAVSSSSTNLPLGQPHDVGVQEDDGHGGLDDDEIDPALREIVNSLTNAQQSSQVGPGLTHAQAAAAIGAHLTDHEERERLQQSLQNTLDDLTQASFGSLFNPNFPQSPTSSFLIPHPTDGPSTSHDPASPSATPSASGSNHNTNPNPLKRSRGRPRGSKNKPKLAAPPRPPKPPKPPSKPRGRPPKHRTEEEQADYEQRRQERALGIKRQKGRPRKFPGYLVREMRLKKNRSEFNELIKRHEESEDHGIQVDMQGMEEHDANGEHGDGGDEGHGEEVYGWSHDDQSLLDVVGAAHLHEGDHGMVVDGETPSGLGKGDEGIREVFGLSGQI